MSTIIAELTQKRDQLLASLDDTANRIQALPPDAPKEEKDVLEEIFERDNDSVNRLTADIKRRQIIIDQRQEVKPQDADDDKPTGTDVRVGKEPLTYDKRSGHSFFKDLAAAKNDNEARERLNRHASEMRVELRDITTTAGAGGEFVPPLYLQNQWIELLRAARPTADALQRFDLPAGTNAITLPRLATGSATSIQASENAGVQETDPTTNSVTANVRSIAGQVDMSRQLFEFSNPGFDEVIFRDLARDYATKLDIQVLSGSGASGQALGLRIVSGVNAIAAGTTATTAALWPKIASAVSSVTSAYLNADTIVMHPRRVAFFRAALDSQNRPLFDAIAPVNQAGNLNNTVANGVVGVMQGIRVISDPNIPTNIGAATNEDVILVFDSQQIYLWEEGAPRTRVFEDVGSGTLTVRLSTWGYFALMANRYPAGISVISGTALVPPAF